MGQEINQKTFSKKDFENFHQKLFKETELLRNEFNRQKFVDEGLIIGLEIEGWLTDKNANPAAKSVELIKNVNNAFVVPELMKFNFELNVTPVSVNKDCFAKLEKQLITIWKKCVVEAEKIGCDVVLIGMLPSAKIKDFKLKKMSNLMRYHALNEQILRKRQNRQIDLSISGIDQYIERFNDILLEASTTSTQIHLQLPPKKALDYFNASVYLSAASVALSSNSPFFFDCHLWEETRIPVFEQIVYIENEQDPKGRKRTGFGTYLNESLMECFDRNLESFSPLLPVSISDDLDELEHLRLHNGTIWRWNRPIIGKSSEKWHLRIEHRPISSGPSIVDIMANVVFYVGAIHALVSEKTNCISKVDSNQAKANFYAAAKYGLNAQMRTQNSMIELKKLFETEYLDLMYKGLDLLNIDKKSQQRYGEIIERRIQNGQTGAVWQAKYIEKHGKNFKKMVGTYVKNQNSNQPVHNWKV